MVTNRTLCALFLRIKRDTEAKHPSQHYRAVSVFKDIGFFFSRWNVALKAMDAKPPFVGTTILGTPLGTELILMRSLTCAPYELPLRRKGFSPS